jgi:hypothetical protein
MPLIKMTQTTREILMKFFITAIFACFVLVVVSARAQEADHPGLRQDDRVIFDVSAEDWVTTKTAHVSVTVEASVNASTAGTMREDMIKAVNALSKADWRLTSFDRSQDQTGMERWSAIFETRLPESELGGLGDMVKKLSKPGMQLSIANIDFTPTLEEMETTRGTLRAQIYKIASDQLAVLNANLPGRFYRIATIDFTGGDGASPLPHVTRGPMAMKAMMAAPEQPAEAAPSPVERAEKVTLTARIVFAAVPEKPIPPPVPASTK